MVKKVLSLFGSNREEDKMTGYLSFLKVGGNRGSLRPVLLAPAALRDMQGPAQTSKWSTCVVCGGVYYTQVGPKLLKFLPGKKAADLKAWLTVYSYWNQGGLAK